MCMYLCVSVEWMEVLRLGWGVGGVRWEVTGLQT